MTGIFKYLKIVLVLLMVSRVFAQTSSDAKENPTPESDPVDVKISGQWFLSYLNGQVNGTRDNLFTVNRG